MEPGPEGQEDRHEPPDWAEIGEAAAMEPGPEGQEDLRARRLAGIVDAWPQWSLARKARKTGSQ